MEKIHDEMVSIALKKERQLVGLLSSIDEVVMIAFSGGVDSTYLLSKAAQVIGRERVIAVTFESELYLPGETEAALVLAQKLPIKHLILSTDPLADREFRANTPERCYFCKHKIYSKLLGIAAEKGIAVVLDGSNADDTADYRPGMRALEELGIRSPLLEVSLNKAEIRELSRLAGLPTWNKPAAACLASRFPYGDEITGYKLKQVAEAECFLRQLGVKHDLRVRYHGSLARIEVNKDDLDSILTWREMIVGKLQELGFVYITLDLGGFESGSMNRLLTNL